MAKQSKPLRELQASDLHSHPVVTLQKDMSLRQAARIMIEKRIRGAPVVDEDGKCVGVLSTIDLLRFMAQPDETTKRRPVTCPFVTIESEKDGQETAYCTLSPGVCPLQIVARGPETTLCREPHCVLTDWQIVELERLPAENVENFMSHQPVTVASTMLVGDLARKMNELHIHRLIVVDEEDRPIGVVSSGDILAAVAAE